MRIRALSETTISAGVEPTTSCLVDALGELIVRESLSPGDRLPSIRELADQFGVKAGAMRDALLDAQGKGLVKVLPRAGAFVQAVEETRTVDAFVTGSDGLKIPMDHNLFHLLEARQLLEVACVRKAAAARRLEDLLPLRDSLTEMEQLAAAKTRSEFVDVDVNFHITIATIAGNPVQVTILRTLLGLLEPHLAMLPWSEERRTATFGSHVGIYEALVDGDVERAEQQMRGHLQFAYDSLLQHVQSVPGVRGSGNGAHEPQ